MLAGLVRMLVVGSSGLQASGHVCMVHGMHARCGTCCAHAYAHAHIGRSSTCTPLRRRIQLSERRRLEPKTFTALH